MDLEQTIEELIESWINGNCNWVIDQIEGFPRSKAMYVIACMCTEDYFKPHVFLFKKALWRRIDETTM